MLLEQLHGPLHVLLEKEWDLVLLSEHLQNPFPIPSYCVCLVGMSSLHNVLHCFNTDLWSLLTTHFPPKSGSNIFLATNILKWYSFFHSFFLLFNLSTIYLLTSKHLCKADMWMYLFKQGFAIDASYGMASCMYCAISRDLPLRKLRELSSSMKAWCLQSRLPFWNLSCTL